jgi:hypothetical protein
MKASRRKKQMQGKSAFGQSLGKMTFQNIIWPWCQLYEALELLHVVNNIRAIPPLKKREEL